jgi:hypothetical protein
MTTNRHIDPDLAEMIGDPTHDAHMASIGTFTPAEVPETTPNTLIEEVAR